MWDQLLIFLAICSIVIGIVFSIRIYTDGQKYFFFTCPIFTRIKPVKVYPINDGGIPFAEEIELAIEM